MKLGCLTGGTEREEQTNRTTRSTVNLQLALEDEADPRHQFKMIDAWLREYERRNRDWPTLAKMCHEVKVKKLWRLGGYKDWSDWVLDAAPVCAKTVFFYVGTYEMLPMNTFHIKPRRLKLVVGEPISTQGMTTHDLEKISEKTKAAIEGMYNAHHLTANK